MYIPPYRIRRLKEEQHLRKVPLVGDGVGKYLEQCKLCGHTDLVFPVNGTYFLCPNCVKRSALEPDEVMLVVNGKCDVCGSVFKEYGFMMRSDVRVCFKCLWYKLGKQRSRLTVGGTHIC